MRFLSVALLLLGLLCLFATCTPLELTSPKTTLLERLHRANTKKSEIVRKLSRRKNQRARTSQKSRLLGQNDVQRAIRNIRKHRKGKDRVPGRRPKANYCTRRKLTGSKSKPKPKSKSLSIVRRAPLNGPLGLDEWKECKLLYISSALVNKPTDKAIVFNGLTTALQNNPKIQREIPLYAVGGISSLLAGLRSGEYAKTDDLDIIYGTDVTDSEKTEFESAFRSIADVIYSKGQGDPFLDSSVQYATKGATKTIIDSSHVVAWRNDNTQLQNRFIIYHTNWLYGLILKLIQMNQCGSEGNEERHIQDAVGLLRKAVAANENKEISMKQLEAAAKVMNEDALELLLDNLALITGRYKGFDEDVEKEVGNVKN